MTIFPVMIIDLVICLLIEDFPWWLIFVIPACTEALFWTVYGIFKLSEGIVSSHSVYSVKTRERGIEKPAAETETETETEIETRPCTDAGTTGLADHADKGSSLQQEV